MKSRFWTSLALVLIAALLITGPTSAQEGQCFGDVVNYQACFVADHALRVLRIEGGQGRTMGTIPGAVYPYAAANLSAPQLVYTLTDTAGYSVELYFTGKTLAEVNGYDTTWTFVFYSPAGAVSRHEFTKRTGADPTVTLPSMPQQPARAASAAAPASAPAPAAVPVSTPYEPAIVRGGTVENCLVNTAYTVRMRQSPSTGAAVLDRVPYQTAMPADMITSDGQWVRAFFVGEGGQPYLGWISARYLNLSDACAEITVAQPLDGGAAIPAVVPPAAAAESDTAAPPAAEPAAASSEPFDPTFGGQLDLTITEPGSVGQCLVRATFTVRIRAMPSDNAPVLDSVPYQSSMPADLRTTDGEWIRANYLGSLGWINSRYLSLSEACEGLSGIAPMN